MVFKKQKSPLNLPNSLALCGNEDGEIGISGKFREIKWNTGATTANIVVHDAGIYTVSVFDGLDWIKDSIYVYRESGLTARPTENHLLCPGKKLILKGNEKATSWLWSSGGTGVEETVQIEGEYIVVSFNECYSVADTFRVQKARRTSLSPVTTVVSCQKGGVTLTAGLLGEQYRWNTGQTDNQITVSASGEYYVTYKVCDSSYTQNFSVEIKPNVGSTPYFPNIFTPNADNVNDVFKMVGGASGITDFSISVFNRWGILLFRSTDPFFEWNGQYKGSVVSEGTYYYGGKYRNACSGESYIQIEGSLLVRP